MIFFRSVAEEIYRGLLALSLLIFVAILKCIPFIGASISFIWLSWMYALYSFEYKWNKKQWTVEQKLTYMENNSIYFAGFGCPVAAITVIFPRYVNSGFYAMMFPMFLLLSIATNPEESGINDIDFPIFYFPKKINNFIVVIIDICRKKYSAPKKKL